MNSKTIVIVGGGFAGTSLATALEKRLPEGWTATLISEESYTTFNPMLAEVVGAAVFPEHVIAPIREMLRMIHAARALGLKIMLGSMVESSLALSAAAQLAPLVDYLDLDGHWLLKDDPFSGAPGERGDITLSARPGLGVLPAASREVASR